MKKILITALVLVGFSATAQVKVGSNPTTLATDANLQVEATDGTQFFINKPNGNVGIGTTTPSEKLDVAGSIKMVDGNQAAGAFMVSDANGKATWTPAATALGAASSKWTNDAANTRVGLTNLSDGTTARTLETEFVVTDAGNVGISVSSPSNSKLEIAGKNLTKFLTFNNTLSGNGDWTFSNMNLNDLAIGYDTSNGASPTSQLYLKYGGNVGIGTTTPTEKLDVAGSIKMVDGNQAAGAFMVSDANGKATWKPAATALGAVSSKWTNNAANTRVGLTNLSDGTTARTVGTEFVVTDAGNVGISVSSPSNSKLEIAGRNLTKFLTFNNTLLGNGDWTFSNMNLNDLAIGYDTSNGASPTSQLYLKYGGNVGIGTTTPKSKLHVTGLPTFADNTAAKAGLGGAGVAEGAFYHAGDGIVRVVY